MVGNPRLGESQPLLELADTEARRRIWAGHSADTGPGHVAVAPASCHELEHPQADGVRESLRDARDPVETLTAEA